MAVLALFFGRGVTQAHYDKLRETVDWEHDIPAGGIFHAAGFDAAGDAHVADVWESQEALDAFVSSRLAPAFQTLGIPPPEVSVFPLHNANAVDAVDRFKPSPS